MSTPESFRTPRSGDTPLFETPDPRNITMRKAPKITRFIMWVGPVLGWPASNLFGTFAAQFGVNISDLTDERMGELFPELMQEVKKQLRTSQDPYIAAYFVKKTDARLQAADEKAFYEEATKRFQQIKSLMETPVLQTPVQQTTQVEAQTAEVSPLVEGSVNAPTGGFEESTAGETDPATLMQSAGAAAASTPARGTITLAPLPVGDNKPPGKRRGKRGARRQLEYKTDENLATSELSATLLLDAVNAATEAVKAQTDAMQQAQQQAMTATQAPPPDEESKVTDEQAVQGVDRQNELSANEVEALAYHDDYTEKLDVTHAYLVKDDERGNVGAGTAATGPIADLWGNLPTQAREDKVVPEILFDTKQDGTLIEGDTEAPEADKFTFLPFAKLGGSIVWIPRNANAAKYFFTSQDYDELVSNVEDGNPLTLAHEDMVDIAYMLDSISKLYMSLHLFCDLAPMLMATTSNRTQIYAEWLELRQLSRAIVAYQQNTAGMYENASISMRGGIRAAVGAALKPLYEKLKVPEPSEQPVAGGSLMDKRKRIGNMGLVEDADFNPQFSFEPLHFKRTKFSIPII